MQNHLRSAGSGFWTALVAALLVVIGLTGPVAAATTGTISGTVVDAATKKPAAGVSVTAVSPSDRATATTDANGFYNIYNLAPDTYVVSFTLKGYEKYVLTGVTVVQDQNVNISPLLAHTIQTIGRVATRNA